MNNANPSDDGDNSIPIGPCGACKVLRRKCTMGCVFAPYFDRDGGAAEFAAIHKVFGAYRVSKLLTVVPVDKRQDAVATIFYEAQARLRDPIYGCVAHIYSLEQQVKNLRAELSYLQAHFAAQATTPFPPQHLPMASMAAPNEFSSFVEPIVPQFPSWCMQPHWTDLDGVGGTSNSLPSRFASPLDAAASDIQALAQDLLRPESQAQPGDGASPPPFMSK